MATRPITYPVPWIGDPGSCTLRRAVEHTAARRSSTAHEALAMRAHRALRWKGRFVTIGFASGEIPRIPMNLVLLKGCVAKGFEIRTFARFEPELATRDERELIELLGSGRVGPHISAVHDLDHAADALNEVAGRRSIGKVLLAP